MKNQFGAPLRGDPYPFSTRLRETEPVSLVRLENGQTAGRIKATQGAPASRLAILPRR